MVLASSTCLIKYTKCCDQVHSIGNSFTHSSVLYSVRQDQMCHILDFLVSAVKYESEANASGKLDTRSDSRKRASDMLET